jgi:predicted dehydrogenase
MVCEVEHAVRVIERGREPGKVLRVSSQRHSQPLFRSIKQQLAAGELGDVQYVTGLQHQNRCRGTRGTWRRSPALSGGGQRTDSGSHLPDLLLRTTGPAAESVSCAQANFASAVDINTAISLRFRGGALGTLAIVGNAPGGMWEDLTLYGSKGAIYYRGSGARGAPRRFQQRRFARTDVAAAPEAPALPAGSDPDTNLGDAIRGRAAVQAPPTRGPRVIEPTEAAWRPARPNGPAEVRQTALA